MRYRADIFIRGAQTEVVYRDTLVGIEKVAIKKLTHWEPGCACLYPDRAVISENNGWISGNKSRWKGVKAIPYSGLSADQHEWRKRRAKQTT